MNCFPILAVAAGIGVFASAAAAPRAYDVLPQDTDPAIQHFKQAHRVFLDDAARPRVTVDRPLYEPVWTYMLTTPEND